jgi:hypothetical protein
MGAPPEKVTKLFLNVPIDRTENLIPKRHLSYVLYKLILKPLLMETSI